MLLTIPTIIPILKVLCLFMLALVPLFVLVFLNHIRSKAHSIKRIDCNIKNIFKQQKFNKFSRIEKKLLHTNCFICDQYCKLEVVPTCNHSLCAQCILRYAQNKKINQLNCPACTKPICVLLSRFIPITSQQKQFKKQITRFNSFFTQKIGFFRAIHQFPEILKHTIVFLSPEGLKFLLLDNKKMDFILLPLIYILSPYDFLPEMILGPLGLVDDVFVSLAFLRNYSNFWIEFVKYKSQSERG